MYSKTDAVLHEERTDKWEAEPNALEIRYERYRGILKNLMLMSDVFMRNVFKERACTEYVLQVIMGRKDLRITAQVLQKDFKNLQGRSAILDWHVIFITRDDVLGYGLPIYHIERRIKETDSAFRDEAYIIYVNSRNQEDTELGRLMHDFHCRDAKDIHSEILARRARELKETQEGVDFMCREMDAIYREGEMRGELRGEERGRIKGQAEMALSLANMGIPVEQIAEAAKVSVNLVQEWLSGNKEIAK